MNKVEKLSIALTPDMAAELRAAVDAGEYGSVSEVIREALRDWRKQRRIDGAPERPAVTATPDAALKRLKTRITRAVCPSCGDPKG